MDKLLFGTAGIPLSTIPPDTINGIKQVRALGLSAMELEFVQSVNISAEKAPQVREEAAKHKVLLTAHGSYYINLNAAEEDKYKASILRILQAGRILSMCGGWSLVFHAGFYLKSTRQNTYEKIKGALKEIRKTLLNEGVEVWIRPETTGKPSQFGDLFELISVSEEVEGVLPCIDFSHLYARSAGRINKKEDFVEMIGAIESRLGQEALKNMHIHLSGINYTEKGERNHLNFDECNMNYKGVLEALNEYKCAGVIISESPNIENDAIAAKKYFETLLKKGPDG
ncbi:MAG: TIM barrel protein [Candidatus Anstonellales archaeon]